MAIIPFRQSGGPKPVISGSRISGGTLLPPAAELQPRETAGEHTSEPIKSLKDIARISQYLTQNQRYRDNMLFILGINFGLRISDLRELRFCDLLDEAAGGFTFKRSFPILEQKTKNTRKVKRNRHITINAAVIYAVELYLRYIKTPPKLDDFLFVSESNHAAGALSRVSVDRILKGIGADLQLPYKMATHTLRKTFAYHQMAMAGNDPRKLLLLQKMFGHSSVAQTLDYIGITNEEIEQAYLGLNLGAMNRAPLLDSYIEEEEAS
ncbi:MAG: tyrosine-type recombinase/integrase [Firmicutes bacterium]|nr:tyrosine-type recombinase/integrase [Bacillota bacterium]